MEENREIIDNNAFIMKYKKSIIVLMALFILTMPVIGAENSTIKIPNATIPSPGLLTLPILIGGVYNAQGLSFNLTYDKDVATVQSIYPNLTIFPGSYFAYINNSMGKTNITLINTNGLNASNLKPVIDITFNVSEGIKNFTLLNILNPKFYINNNTVPAQIVENGGITIGENSEPPITPPPGGSTGVGGGGGYLNYDALVTGLITSNNTPIPNAVVGITNYYMGPVNWGRANETGYYSIGAITGEGSVFATASGFVGRKNRTTFQQNNTINFNLRYANETHGSVKGYVYTFNASMGMYTGVENVLGSIRWSSYGTGQLQPRYRCDEFGWKL